MDSELYLILSGPDQEQASTPEQALNQRLFFDLEDDKLPGDNLFGSDEKIHPLTYLPPGYRFVPKDHELINDYLKKKINDEPMPYCPICYANVYNYTPQELTETYPSIGDNEWYFFTSREGKYQTGNRRNRAAANGCWKVIRADTEICHNNACIGFKKTLHFYEGNRNGKKTNWKMLEYTVDQPSGQQNDTNDMLLDNCVLCRIHYITSSRSSKQKSQAAASKSCKT